MNATEFELDSHTFRINRLEPRKAFHVMRRIAPLVGGLKDALPYLMGKPLDPDDLGRIAEVFEPAAAALAKLPEGDCDYVLDACLAVAAVKDHHGKAWAPLQSGGAMMFDWLTTPVMLQIVIRVLRENLSGFFSGEASAS